MPGMRGDASLFASVFDANLDEDEELDMDDDEDLDDLDDDPNSSSMGLISIDMVK